MQNSLKFSAVLTDSILHLKQKQEANLRFAANLLAVLWRCVHTSICHTLVTQRGGRYPEDGMNMHVLEWYKKEERMCVLC